jgi:hypothetical protein
MRIYFAAGTTDLHKSFEGLHKLTPFQLQLSAVNLGDRRPSSTLVCRGRELTAECQRCSRIETGIAKMPEVPAGIRRILILIVYTGRV